MGLLDRFKKKKEEPKQAPKPKKSNPKDSNEPWVDVIEVKLDIDNGIPRFNVASTSDRTISNLVLRSKNGYNRTSDKLGFKV